MSALRDSKDGSVKPLRHARQQTMSIGVVLERLRGEFPDVTVSKIRFLESEGLITPSRTPSGYRRFTDKDVERLRYILVTQRDNYTPLKVIRQQLEAMDSGEVTALLSATKVEPIIRPEEFRAPAITRLTDDDVAAQADVDKEFVRELAGAGLISADPAGFFTADDVRVASTARALTEFGFDVRHLKSVRHSARRQADLISQVTTPVAQSGSDVAKHKAQEISEQLTALVVSLHASLVKNDLRS